MVERNGVGIGLDEHRFVEKFEDALGCGHRGLEDVEFFAEVLNRPEKALREHGERGEDAESDAAGENAISAGPINQRNRGETEKLDRGIEESVSENGDGTDQRVEASTDRGVVSGRGREIEGL